ncbi:MAG: hypothetical protein [Caudoviricetes sp.]|nr:MAG: hypothetical protein [Caudoviricetes sp.]
MIEHTAPSGASSLINLNGDAVNVGVVGTSAGVSAAAQFFGLTINEWFYIAAIIYTFFIIIDKGVDIFKKAKYKAEWTTEDDKVRLNAKSNRGGD